jgi:hypothetical protein
LITCRDKDHALEKKGATAHKMVFFRPLRARGVFLLCGKSGDDCLAMIGASWTATGVRGHG